MNRSVQDSDVLEPVEELDLSVLIPAYNEQQWILSTLYRLLEYLRNRTLSFEIIVVEDGSTERTLSIAETVARQEPEVKVFTNGMNKGKGYTLRHGVRMASGKMILMYDADGSTPIEEIERLETVDLQEYPIVIGSRAVKETDTKLEALKIRKWIGRTFNFWVTGWLGLRFRDTQCGFKLFRADVAKVIFGVARINRFAIDPEFLFIAKKRGFQVKEVAINWAHKTGSSVTWFTGGMAYVDVVKIRIMSWQGCYKRPKAA